MNTRQFKYVLVLAREGSFSRAADMLNISQPSLSQYIRKIEKEIGLALFDRSNGEVRITDAGRVYVETGRQILDLEHRMENTFSDLALQKTGSLVVGTAPYRAASMMPTVAASFQKRFPGMHLVIREGTTAELSEGVEHGEYDLALTLLPVDNRLFAWEKLVEEELILAVPSSFSPFPSEMLSERRYLAVETEVLEDQALVMLTEAQYMQRQLKDLLVTAKLRVKTAVVVKSLEAQIEMVRAGVGMALVPSGIERFCTDGSVRFYSFVEQLPKREVVVMWRRDRTLSGLEKELLAVMHAIDW